jgi:hypothetical protein
MARKFTNRCRTPGRDYLSEENSLLYGDLFQTRGTTTEKSWLLMSQNIIRNDKRAFSPSHAAPNSSAEFTPNNGSWPLLVKSGKHLVYTVHLHSEDKRFEVASTRANLCLARLSLRTTSHLKPRHAHSVRLGRKTTQRVARQESRTASAGCRLNNTRSTAPLRSTAHASIP